MYCVPFALCVYANIFELETYMAVQTLYNIFLLYLPPHRFGRPDGVVDSWVLSHCGSYVVFRIGWLLIRQWFVSADINLDGFYRTVMVYIFQSRGMRLILAPCDSL